jgi:peroxiredoxin
MIRCLSAFFFLALLFAPDLFAQKYSRTVSGLVTTREEGASLPGVLVYVKGTNNTSGTQQDGMYYIEVTDHDSTLVFRYDDYQTQEVCLDKGGNCNYNVVLCRGKAPFSPLGTWRGVFEVKPGLEVPFNFDIRTVGSEQKVFFRNGDEQFDGGHVKVTADSLILFLDQFDNELAFRIGDNTLTGVLRRQDNTGSVLQVRATPGVSYRFTASGAAPAGNISGAYDIVFHTENGKEEKAVGLFRQDGSKLTGTFLRVTGDSRYLEGIVEGNNFYLSSFIGSGPAFYKGSFSPDGKLTGEIAGAHAGQSFTGIPNANAALPDPYKLTFLKEGYSAVDFSFPDIDGRPVSLRDAKFKNKVVIVTIGGTWCPNCVDETAFLAPWYKTNHARGVELVSIQYERQTDPVFVKKVLSRMREKYDIQYDQVFGGLADKQGVAASLPALNTFLAFPTTIIIDKKGRVAQIHTGYSGPATGEHYQQFVKEFNTVIDSLL